MVNPTSVYSFEVKDEILEGFKHKLTNCANRLEINELIVSLPDGFATIGEGALQSFCCRRLVMPPSLKTIRNKAFERACIDEIDFSQCKLENIESQAFTNGHIKAVLPDTVKYVGSGALLGLELEKDGMIKLPSSLFYIGIYALNLKDIRVLDVNESLVEPKSGLEDLILMSGNNISKWLILNVRRNGRLVCRVPMPECKCYMNYKNCYICDKGFNYSTFDEWFTTAKERILKTIIAAFRSMYPEGLTDEAIKAYRDYIITNCTFLMRDFEEDIEVIRLYDEAGLITPYRLKQLLENARAKNNAEVTTLILDLLNRKSGSKAKSLML
jgi:hypothetical protein